MLVGGSRRTLSALQTLEMLLTNHRTIQFHEYTDFEDVNVVTCSRLMPPHQCPGVRVRVRPRLRANERFDRSTQLTTIQLFLAAPLGLDRIKRVISSTATSSVQNKNAMK